jgi:hypothetical protein
VELQDALGVAVLTKRTHHYGCSALSLCLDDDDYVCVCVCGGVGGCHTTPSLNIMLSPSTASRCL